MKPAPFAYAAPRDVDEVLALLAAHGHDAKALAGGQSLLPMMNLRLAQPAILVDLNRVGALTGITREPGLMRIGATTRQLEIERELAADLPLVAQSLRWVGHVATRGRGTFGGSLVHADPAAELPAVLLALDGQVTVRSVRGQRAIPARDLFVGTFTTALAPDELLTEVRLPVRAGARHAFVEFARRHGDFALVGAAVEVVLGSDDAFERVALALLGVADVPRRLPELEAALVGRRPGDPDLAGEVSSLVSSAVDPPGDVHASGAYRSRIAGVAAVRALASAAETGAEVPHGH